MIESPDALVAAARSYLKVPWRHQGRDHNGIDCAGLIIVAAREAGWEPLNPVAIELLNYRRIASTDVLKQTLRAEGAEVEWANLRAGDVVLFDFPQFEHPQHIGIVIGTRQSYPYVIHADAKLGRVTEHAATSHWRDAFVAGYRFFDLAEVS